MSKVENRGDPPEHLTDLLMKLRSASIDPGEGLGFTTYTMRAEPSASEGSSWVAAPILDPQPFAAGAVFDPSTLVDMLLRQYLSLMLQQIETGYLETGSLISKKVDSLNVAIKDIREGTDILLGISKTRTESIFILNLRNPNFRLTQPIPITLAYEQDEVIARYDDVGLYGSGEFREDALRELCESIIEYYETLSEEKDNLGPLPQGHWEFLRQIIQEA